METGRFAPARCDTMKGRILVDVPEHGLRCGEYVDIPDETGEQLSADGRFDTLAPDPSAPESPVPNAPTDPQPTGEVTDPPNGGQDQQNDLLGVPGSKGKK